MATLGATVAKIGDQMHDRALAAQEYETEAKFQEFKWNQEKDFEEQMRAVEPGQANGFADRWSAGYKDRAKEFFATVPEPFKAKYDAKLFGVERHLHNSGTSFAYKEQTRDSVHKLEDHKNRLATLPDLDRARTEYDEFLHKNPFLTPIEKDEIRRKHLDDLEEQNVEHRINRGEALDVIIKDLETGRRPGAKSTGRTSAEGLDFIRRQEGYTPGAKWDHKQYSIGYGTKGKPGERITKEEAERRLEAETGAVSDWIAKNVTVPLTQSQHDALVSFGYNLGTGQGGLESLKDDINAEKFDRVADRMLSFNKASGKTEPGLVRRRREEADMFRRAGGEAMLPPEMEGGGEPAEGEGAALPSKYVNLSPKRRAALLHKARTALSATTQQSIHDDIERIRRTGEPEIGADGKTSLDRAGRILTPNQAAKYKIAWDEAVMEHKALSPLAHMSEEEARAHIDSFTPDAKAPQESYASVAKVQDKANRAWAKIKEAREKDPAASVAGSPEVRAAAETLKGKGVVIGADEEGNPVLTQAPGAPPLDPRQAWESVIRARLQAQKRLGIPEYAAKPITRGEADRLLAMPKDIDPASPDYMKSLRAAAAQAEELYGPRYASKALRTAIGYRLRDAENRDMRAAMVAKLARGETISGRELASMSALANIDRMGRLFDAPQTADPEADPDLPSFSLASESQYSRAGFRLQEASEKANKKPNPRQRKWIEDNPDQWQAFDMEFGRGAAAAILKGAKKK
jgi:lysozyme